MNKNNDTYNKGLALLNQLHGGQAGAKMVGAQKDICPDFATMTIEWAMAEIMARPGLDLLTREYVVIASCVTLGHAVPQLRAHISAAMKLGATKEQVVEVILQTIFYAGGAAVANALNTTNEAFKLADPSWYGFRALKRSNTAALLPIQPSVKGSRSWDSTSM